MKRPPDMRPFFLLTLLSLLSLEITAAQSAEVAHIHILDSGRSTNLRGLSSRDGSEIWVSGSNGWVGHTKDGGSSWNWLQPQGYQQRDFRDVQALGNGSAVIMGIDTPAVLLKTTSGGTAWKQVYFNNTPGMFLDAMDFSDNQNGIVVGDPVGGQIFLARTQDGAESWQAFTPVFKDSVLSGEAFFAASGSNIHLEDGGYFLLPSGGAVSRFWNSSRQRAPVLLPLQQGILSAGPNGMDVQGNIIAIAGGDYTKPGQGDSCFALSFNGGRTWEPQHALPGYGSAVAIINKHTLIACGLTGVWISYTSGKSWQTLDNTPFNALLYIKKQNRLLLAGPHGKIGVLENF
ncbi:WD40/YVTN/BNR-like repeat-containing protein [Arachidicoccus rhizosphaerae]|nr:YCF48-related protein [Arachidicoccus rhizosphaerae]